eukprot:TRINITY_DN30013_c0_g1_i1.p1 TRINITY_DN30013_c0_g1~~TRINITY_DN30013_c0_g1_i1.p1  ORF type:complete len:4546 (+),score=1598.05 TRINITY_DN30013_c0_g1_i1:76-13638(+)
MPQLERPQPQRQGQKRIPPTGPPEGAAAAAQPAAAPEDSPAREALATVTAVHALKHVTPVVIRVGEIFAELGWALQGGAQAPDTITQWALRVCDESLDVVYDAAHEAARCSKVLKLRAGHTYTFAVRLYDQGSSTWGHYSQEGRLRTYAEARTKCTEIGENYCVLQWDRPQRPADPSLTPERNPDAAEGVRSLHGFQLRILRQRDSETEFHQEFDADVRSYTIHGLRPGEQYSVHARWHTLLGQHRQWQEALRFATSPSYCLQLNTRGEDSLTFSWSRPFAQARDDEGNTYQTSPEGALRFEVMVEGPGQSLLDNKLELQSHATRHTLTGLLPASVYCIRLRAMNPRGRWGILTDPLRATTLSVTRCHLVTVGELHCTLRWARGSPADAECDTAYRVNLLGLGQQYSFDRTLDAAQAAARNSTLTIGDLTPGSCYKAYVQAKSGEEWGLWSEGVEFTTHPRPVCHCIERGEDFFTFGWQRGEESAASPAQPPGPPPVYRVRVECTAEASRGTVVHEGTQEGPCPSYRVPGLTPDCHYQVQVRASQGVDEDGEQRWGTWSDPLQVQTLRPVALQVSDIGEAFVQLEWRRALHVSADVCPSPTGRPPPDAEWFDLKYEVVLGCVDSGEDDVLHKQVLETSYRIANLTPNTTYSVAVRASDERGQWGLWSVRYFRTLSSVALRCHEVGEDFVRVVWQREATGQASKRLADVLSADNFVSKYRLLLFANEAAEGGGAAGAAQDPPAGGEQGDTAAEEEPYPGAARSKFVRDMLLDPSHTSQRIADLIPDGDYTVVVRAQTRTGVWGLWSAPQIFHTVAPFKIPVGELSIGENYVHFTWGRDSNPTLGEGVVAGDYAITRQQLRIRGLDDNYSHDRTLQPVDRDLKIYGLKPATAYSIQIRSCNTAGEWGVWSREVRFQTRATIVARAVEVSENYIVVRWERKSGGDRGERGYPSGRGFITRYHLRVTGEKDFSFDAELVEADQPYKIPGLSPDTRYRVVIKANYNDDEWGLWSGPLLCLTLRRIEIKTTLIGEEFAAIRWSRPEQSRVLPDKDHEEDEGAVLCFGARRPEYQLRVTSADLSGPVPGHAQLTWAGVGLMETTTEEEEEEEVEEDIDVEEEEEGPEVTSSAGRSVGKRRKKPADEENALLMEMRDHKIVLETTLTDEVNEVPFTIPGLRPDTNYCIIVRSRISDGDWGVWSRVQQLITLKPNEIAFVAIGEDFARITWERPPQVITDPRVARGRGVITKSQLKVKSPTGQVQTYDIDSTQTQFTAEDLQPASTYYVSVRTFNDNHDWGLWSADRNFRTVAGMHLEIPQIGEDYFWLVFARRADTAKDSPNCVVSVDTSVSRYQIKVVGDDGFSLLRELSGDAWRSFSLQGLAPHSVYDVAVRGLSRHNVWGQWANQQFKTRCRIVVDFGNIGEHFAIVRWERPGEQQSAAGGNTLTGSSDVSKFRLRIAEVGSPATARLFDLPASYSSFKVPDLSPNTEYSIWICSLDKRQRWGVWSTETRLRTLPPLLLDIQDIGEAYACVAWNRERATEPQPQLPPDIGEDGPVRVREGRGEVKQFHVRVEGRLGVVVERYLGPDVGDCKVEGLQADTVYRVTVRVCDVEGEWGLWAAVQKFITLRPVELSVQKVGEDFIHLEWGRRAERRRASIGASQVTETDLAATTLQQDEDADEEFEEFEEDEEGDDDEGFDAGGEGGTVDGAGAVKEDIWAEDGDIVMGNSHVQRWLIRIIARPDGAASSATPPSDSIPTTPQVEGERSETELDADEVTKRFTMLDPNTTYTIAARALSASGEWGFWSPEETVCTLPLIQTTISYIGEDFIICTWCRPRNSQLAPRLVVFPPENHVHTYQLKITPVGAPAATPPPDPGEGGGDEEAAGTGERDFDISQPKYEVWDMAPGTRYWVGVREKDVDGAWGMWSERQLVQTLDPMGVSIVDLGECFSLVAWDRVPRPQTAAGEVVVSQAKPTLYQISVDLMQPSAEEGWAADGAFHLQKSFRPPESRWNIDSLVPNKVYSVRARCQTDSEYWGGWSDTLMFVTVKTLSAAVYLINEDNVVVSWRRNMPDWLTSPESSAPSTPQNRDGLAGSLAGSDEGTAESPRSGVSPRPARASPSPSAHNAYPEMTDWPEHTQEMVKLGNYDVTEYELRVEGLGNDATFILNLPANPNSHRISGLQPNSMYSVTVRSRNTFGVWSLWAQRISVLTLNPLRMAVGKCAEGFAWVSWIRDTQRRGDYAPILSDLHAMHEQEYKQRIEERVHERRQREEEEAEEMEESTHSEKQDEHGSEADAAGPTLVEGTAEVVGVWKHLQVESLQIHRGTCSAYHLRVWGDEGCLLNAEPHQRLPADDRFVVAAEERRRRREQRALAQQQQKRKDAAKAGQRGPAGSPGRGGRGAGKRGKKKRGDEAAEHVTEDGEAAEDHAEEEDNADDDAERCIFDTQLVATVRTFRLEGLAPDQEYQIAVRARNVEGEWGLWCAKVSFETLAPLRVEHAGFGEHYINLYWFRPTREVLAAERERDAASRAYEEVLRQREELHRQQKAAAEAEGRPWTKPELTPEEQAQERDAHKQHKARLREQRARLEERREGLAPVATNPETPLEVFMLRVVAEDGTIEDRLLPAYQAGAPQPNLFTVASLSPNHLYVVQMCCCYGDNEWGPWSPCIKFMTQNLIQLSISYVGESFIQLDWKRAPNKRFKGEDMREVQQSPTEQGIGHQYQIMVCHESKLRFGPSGEEQEQYIDVVDQNNFRVSGLISDMKYSLGVREWDPKGEWGLWSAQRCCLTLSRMMVAVKDIGEHWIDFAWERQQPRIKYDDPGMVTIPVSVTAYYLNIEELCDNDLPEDEEARQEGEEGEGEEGEEEAPAEGETTDPEAKEKRSQTSSADAEEREHEDRMAAHLRRQRRKQEEDRHQLAVLEAAVAETMLGSYGATGRYRITKKLDPMSSFLRIDDLRPDRFYNIRVQAETSGRELGVWSPDTFFVTMRQIQVSVDIVNEDSFQLSWLRPPTRRHQRLHEYVYEGDLGVAEFELEVVGRGDDNRYEMTKTFLPSENHYRISGVGMDKVYAFAVRSKDQKGRWSLWSPPRELVTLRQLRVMPMKISEQLAIVQWGRDPQLEEQYPQRSDDVPFLISPDRTIQFHVRVWNTDDRHHPLVDKTFIGSINHYSTNYLTPNTSYIVEARACNAAGEWGAWSKKMEFYTMKLLGLEVSAVGEDYVKLKWWRDAPDIRSAHPATDSAAEVERHDDLPPPPVPAEMPQGVTVYTTPETRIDRFHVHVSSLGTAHEWERDMQVVNTDGRVSTFRVKSLQPDKRYQVQVRACYEDEEWGTWSQGIATATLNVISVQAVQAGENYVVAQWHRLEHTYQPQWGDPELHLGTLEETLRYQYRVVDCSEAILGDMKPGSQKRLSAARLGTPGSGSKEKEPVARTEDGELIVRENFTTADSITISELAPNRRYKILVRHWCHPIEKQLMYTPGDAGAAVRPASAGSKTSAQQPAAAAEGEDGAAAEEPPQQGTPAQPEAEEGEPGIWGEPAAVATLKSMVASVDEIAEDFFSLRWERDPEARTYPVRSVARLTPEVQAYHVKIDQLQPDGTGPETAEGSLHIDHEFGPDETAFRVTNLLPDTVYRVEVRARADGEWGMWSKPCVLITLPKLSVTVNSIGEDYAVISWGRQQRQLEHMQALIGSSTNVSRYHVEMFAVDGPFHADKKFKASRTSYKVKRLDCNNVYTVRVRSCDSGNVWSLWSEKSCFVTMKPVRVIFGKVAEQFVHVHWSRDDQSAAEYKHEPPPQLPDTTTTKYHLCVFAAEHAPTSALLDKQFGGDTLTHKVTNLNPNSMYIVIVRASNSEMQWGLWSEERTVLTLQLLSVKINCIGENYISVGWLRDEQLQSAALQTGVVTPATQWHIVVTGQDLQYDKLIAPSEVEEPAQPTFVVRGLRPDQKYILTLRSCYGEDEWGLWTNPVTFLTLNQLGLTVSNISEDRADFTWGRGAQSAQHTYDPNLVVWKGIITKYSLVIRKIKAVSQEVSEDGVPAAATPAEGEDEFCVERDMELNRYKYIQTYCTVDDLVVNTEYTVRVRAQDERQEWGEWTELVFETPPLPPGKPVLNKAHTNFVAFSWDPPDPYNRYLYCVEQAMAREPRAARGAKEDRTGGSGDGLDWKVVDTVSDTQAKVKSSAAISKLRFRIKCCKMDKPVHLWSKYSSVAAFTSAAAPDAVTNLQVTSLSKNSATLEWAKPAPQTAPGARQATAPRVTYKVHLGEKDGNTQLVGTTRQCRYELTDLKTNTHYRVQVQVETDSGISARNTVLKFSTRADTAGDRGRSGSLTGMPTPGGKQDPRGGKSAPSSRGGEAAAPSATESSDTGDAVRLPSISPPASGSGPRGGVPKQPHPPAAPAAPAPGTQQRAPGSAPAQPHPPSSGSAKGPRARGGAGAGAAAASSAPPPGPVEGHSRPPRRPQPPSQPRPPSTGDRPPTAGSMTAAALGLEGAEQLPPVRVQGSDMVTSPTGSALRDTRSNHSDEEYDIVSFQQSDDEDE